jgi:cytoskeletal protein RodZ
MQKRDDGFVNGWLVATISMVIVSVLLLGLSVWLAINYFDQKNNVDSKISVAVSDAQKKQADADEAKFLIREKQPNKTFYGPDDYGRVSFEYPKTWSVYVDNDASDGGDFEAYLNPVSVPPIDSNQLFALRVTIEDKDYDQSLGSFESKIKSGDLKSSSVSANGVNGTKFVGKFSEDLRGAAVLFKIRDKTLTIQTDANTFMNDFEALIKTIKFNQ